MPNHLAEPMSYEESLRLLREFLYQLEQILADLAEYPGPIIPGRHHENLRAAWQEVQPVFKTATDSLRMPEASNLVLNMERCGLTGYQLKFKVEIFQHARGQLLDYGTPKEGQGKKRRWWNRLRTVFKPALKAADVILGSLATVLPILEAVKEYKESVESGAELGSALGESTTRR